MLEQSIHPLTDMISQLLMICSPSQEIAEVEQSYSSSILRLLRSTSYTFHSNILVQWLGSEPYEEIGYDVM